MSGWETFTAGGLSVLSPNCRILPYLLRLGGSTVTIPDLSTVYVISRLCSHFNIRATSRSVAYTYTLAE